jgi:N-acetylglutamate synthase-like GNAT family acetyltransferase
MNFLNVSAADTYPLRRDVLGWDDEHSPSDNINDTRHLAIIGDEREVQAIASYRPQPFVPMPGVQSLLIYGVAVETELQRNGHGRALMQELGERAVLLGYSLLWANSRLSALDFYKKLGFVKTEGTKSNADTDSSKNPRHPIHKWLVDDYFGLVSPKR